MRRIKRRHSNSIIWIAAFVGCVVFASTMLMGVIFIMSDNVSARAELENSYKKSFFEMADSVNAIEINLSKMMVSASEEQTVEMAGQIRQEAQMAQNSLNQLPVNDQTAHDVNKFLNQVGDWCSSYSRALLNGGEASIFEDRTEDLYIITKSVNAELRDMATGFKDGNYSVSKNLKRKGIRSAGDFAMSYDTLNGGIMEYPELIYDGPFSDSEGEKSFKALDHLEPVSEEQALEKINGIFKDMGLKNVKSLGVTNEPEAYEFKGDIAGGTVYMSVSKNGGRLMSANSDLTAGREGIDKERAKEFAVSYAANCGYSGLTPVWYNSINGTAYINLAPKVNEVIHYPDLVKVKVGLDDGKFIALEATGFCTNNCSRELEPVISAKTAKGLVSPKLNITQCRLAVIPINQSEKLCYEVVCDYKGLDYFVYIDAISGKQANILRVVDEDQGEMTF